ncbi:selenocysteine-specific translation elongation factor [Desulfogranum mediterraneum]|uniref:selenocysteine-specific translation elongation factor n=1 Tax=Desulfogranum mediterraneum TaxID=160661 RepID=UPI00040743F4|nr:selenocysteine-specific translation elongation factor [Desulfogranum mediterraneum]
MREIVLGTAGHVDHGKTSFIKALTGTDTDRLKEEKQRGITIELGFAHLDLPCGHRLGIVDVPGHEKFIRNMVAGAAGMDLVAFIIAADEGIMPQTKEHFDICRLLGVKNGLIILTKKDMVEPDWLEMVEEEIRDFFQGSFLEEAPLVPVSSVTGEGLDRVIELLDRQIREMEFKEEFGPFRMAVDRVFSMKGFGTVITGTSLSGRITNGEELSFYPQGLTARIRGIQVHGKDVEVVEAGHRTAINLQGIDREEINRGDMAATPGSLSPSTLLDAHLLYLDSSARELKNRALVRVHLGTREIIGKVLLLEQDRLPPGESANIQLILQEPVTVWPGDHYVLRSYSPITTVGGGVILNPAPRKRKRTQEKDRLRNAQVFATLEDGSVEEKILLFLEESGLAGISSEKLAAQVGIFGKKLKKMLQQPISSGQILVIDSESQRLMAQSVFSALEERVIRFLDRYHQDNPLKSGLDKEELRSQLLPPVDARLLQYTLAALTRKEEIEQQGAEIKRAGFTVTLQIDEQAMQEEIGALYQEAQLAPPNLKDVLARFAQFPERQILQVFDLLLEQGVLTKINESLFFSSQALDRLAAELESYIRREGEIDAPRFKELTGLTRKFSIPLLEYFDKIKLTIRVGDKRVLRKS